MVTIKVLEERIACKSSTSTFLYVQRTPKNKKRLLLIDILREYGVEWRHSKTVLGKSKDPDYDLKKAH